MKSPKHKLSTSELRLQEHHEFSTRIAAIMNCFLQEKKEYEEEAFHQRQLLSEQHEQALARKNTTIEQLSSTVESLSIVLKGCREELQQMRIISEQKGWEVEDIRRVKDTQIAILKEKLQQANRRSPSQTSWYSQSTQPTIPNSQDLLKPTCTPLKVTQYAKPLDWRQSTHQPSTGEQSEFGLYDRPNRLTSVCSGTLTSARTKCSPSNGVITEQVFKSPQSYASSRPTLQTFPIGKENVINRPLTTFSKFKKNTTFLKKKDNIKIAKDEEPSLGLNHNRSTSQALIQKPFNGDMRPLKRLSEIHT